MSSNEINATNKHTLVRGHFECYDRNEHVLIDYADQRLVDSVNTVVVDAPPILPEHLQSKINAALVCDRQDCSSNTLIQ